MRITRRWAARALPVIITAALGVAITAGPASAQGPNQICTAHTYNGHNQCLNLWNDNEVPNAPIKYYHRDPNGNNPENLWAPSLQGYVVGSNCGQPGQRRCWPFVTGSGYNAQYNGAGVWVFAFFNNQNYCMDQGAYNATYDTGYLEIQGCGPTDPTMQYFVSTGSSFLVGVYATDVGYVYGGHRNFPVWVASVNSNWLDGAQAVMSNANANAFFFF